jgi:hypothetical protein
VDTPGFLSCRTVLRDEHACQTASVLSLESLALDQHGSSDLHNVRMAWGLKPPAATSLQVWWLNDLIKSYMVPSSVLSWSEATTTAIISARTLVTSCWLRAVLPRRHYWALERVRPTRQRAVRRSGAGPPVYWHQFRPDPAGANGHVRVRGAAGLLELADRDRAGLVHTGRSTKWVVSARTCCTPSCTH